MLDTESQSEHIASHIRVLERIDLTSKSPQEAPEAIKAASPTTSVIKEELLWISGALDNLQAAKERGFLTVKKALDTNELLDIELQPLQNLPPTLGHLTDTASFARNSTQPIWGIQIQNNPILEQTYLQTTDFTVEAFQNNDYSISLGGIPEKFYRVYVDTATLLKSRNIFLDMESIDVTPEDFGKSFIVPGGIPKEAIIRAELIEVSPRPLSDFIEDIEEFDEDTYLGQAVRNDAALEDFLTTLQ